MNRAVVTGGLMLTMFLAAIDGTIVSTVLPTIVGALKGFDLLPWVGAIYLLASAGTVPVYGKLSDLYGRKKILFFGIALFLLGSALSGVSQSMQQLVMFRALQGIGAGAVLPVATTIVGDIYTVTQRARMQGYFSSVWGISAVLGPLLGGFLVDNLSWHWVFYINVPIGLVAFVVLGLFYHEHVPHQRHAIDYVGSITLILGVSGLMLALLEGGHLWPWASLPSLALFGGSIVLLAIMLLHEARFPEPMVPLKLFRQPLIAVSNLAGLLVGVLIVGISYYVPVFVQGLKGASATTAGSAIMPLSIGWPLASTFSGRLLLRFGYRRVAVAGLACDVLGTLGLFALRASSPVWAIGAATFIIGVGLGLSTTVFMLAVQNAVGRSERGVATASQQFVRSLGSTFGLAVLGALLFWRFGAVTAQAAGPAQASHALAQVNLMLDPATRGQVTADVLPALQQGLFAGVRAVFAAAVATAALALITVFFLPDEVPHEAPAARAGGEQAAG